jgi:serine/threonine-protein kinase
MEASSPIETVRALGKYNLIEKLGEGLLGPVYRGIDQDLGRAVVVRILRDNIQWDAKIEELFYRECRSVAGLQHPNIVAIFDVAKEGPSTYIAMESLGGTNLQGLIAQKSTLPVEAKLSIMIQVSEGLHHAYRNGILHGALEPAKIHLKADGSVKIRDFAIAQVLKGHLPHPRDCRGKRVYLSPEQIQQRDCDGRSDIFSAGVIFYELLTYLHPFYDPDGDKMLDNILMNAQVPTFEQFPEAPPGIWTILKTCLAKDPKDRYRSMEELCSACKELLKSMEEDAQLMLSELYASLAPLKKAAAQPDASENTLDLLQHIESLAHGAQEADYTSLDRLMMALIEQYPIIQAVSRTPNPLCLQFTPTQREVEIPAKGGPLALEKTHENADDSPSGMRQMASVGCLAPEEEAERPHSDTAACVGPATENPRIEANSPPVHNTVARWRCPRIPRSAWRYAAVLLSSLVLATAGYGVLGTKVHDSFASAWKHLLNAPRPKRGNAGGAPAASGAESGRNASAQNAAANQLEKSPWLSGENDLAASPGAEFGATNGQPPRELLARVAALTDSNSLQAAKAQLDRLQQMYPRAPEVMTLRKRWQAKSSNEAQEQLRREEEKQRTARQQREDEMARQLTEFFARGRYDEASNLLNSWQAENSLSPRAQEYRVKIEEIQRGLKACASALNESRYQDALNALGSAEKINPADPNLTELHRQIETRKAAARALLTVHRLGAKAILLLDGRVIGNDGEIENESLPIGSHTLAIENDGNVVASRTQEFPEGTRVALVYDLAKLNLRPMAESDRELLVQRKTMEEVHSFEVEHDHGLLRGSCRGVLSLDYLDVAFKPTSGWHGFRIPFKLLKLGADGKSVDLLYVSDNKHFQSFRFRDEQTAEKFRRIWDELKTYVR